MGTSWDKLKIIMAHGAQDEHMQHTHTRNVKLYTHNDTCNVKTSQHENLKERDVTFFSLVLEAVGLIISELPPAFPKTRL